MVKRLDMVLELCCMLVAEFTKVHGVMTEDMVLLMKNIKMEMFFKENSEKVDLMDKAKEFGQILVKFIKANGFKD